ncbi:AraC family transcriptional regulator [Winogradskyella sp. SYSU M77433]|uniref:helix-turn-helix domain-containing protein n=1 Tax=Winogradskyella sp. SYSU M77433 TaxID=3042722 RepID=UPI0024809A16|nr:AraC family transcriptional regulator [Winogradskyella sp. SYSU M77433]MDH7912888.1 AraC family transcriptional regulator [Winogradskyella sp. SYSU M77433]
MYKSATLKADNSVDIVKLLSENLEVKIEKENNEYCIDIPKELGDGHIKAISFENGISLIEVDVLLNKSFRIRFKKDELNPLILLFNVESKVTHSNSSNENENKIERFESLMFSNDMKDYNTLLIHKNKATSFIKIYINRKEFEKKLDHFEDNMGSDLETIFKDVNGVNLFSYKGQYSMEISEAIDAIKNCESEGLVKSMFIESKTYEILTLHFQQYTDDLNDPKKRQILRRSTIDKVEKAAKIVNEDLAANYSVNQLAKKVGLNQNTLQSGFQHLFNSSVNDYVKSKRIIKAKELIENTDLNITEITYSIGINSRSYFSKLFKEKYKLTPKEYLDQVRKDKTA